MSLLARLFGRNADSREPVRPLWHQTIALARDPAWYAECGVADTVAGRFDMVSAVLSLVLMRMEASPSLKAQSALITELFVEEMDGQLRELGTNDVVVGKRMGKIVSVLGGRLGAYRAAVKSPDRLDQLATVVTRNVSMAGDASPVAAAEKLAALHDRLARMDDATLMAVEDWQ